MSRFVNTKVARDRKQKLASGEYFSFSLSYIFRVNTTFRNRSCPGRRPGYGDPNS